MTLAAPINNGFKYQDQNLQKRIEVAEFLSNQPTELSSINITNQHKQGHSHDEPSLINRTDARILNELFPGRSFATANLVEIAPSSSFLGKQRQSSRLRLKPVPKKERLANDVNSRLSDLVQTLED